MITERVAVEVRAPIAETYRAQQITGLFDLQPDKSSSATFAAEIPRADQDWRIGLIVGPSGSGKTTIARAAYGDRIFTADSVAWPDDQSLLEAFPAELGIKQIAATLTAVGFSSPPAWLRPFRTLSNGEQFRATLAAALTAGRPLVVMDEFTSVVDRTVAQIGSAALAKQLRADRLGAMKFVAVGCHYDVIDWLCPDWILDTATFELTRRRLRRPAIVLQIHRCAPRAWRSFRRHHYLTGDLHKAARCWLATWQGRPVCFVATLNQHGAVGCRRISRFVTLPDFQGVGIGAAVLAAVAAEEARQCRRVRITTSHPAVISHCQRAAWWRCVDYKPLGYGGRRVRTKSTGRSVANFQFLPDQYHPPTP